MSDIRNYRLVYPDPRTQEEEPSGGYVEVHISLNSHETERNIETAILLAKLGYQVRLLPIDTAFRKPDACLEKLFQLSKNTFDGSPNVSNPNKAAS